ncbi:MAG: hypothetical protein KJZ79_23355 [Bryobacteraceae bacterium]|nr:hypothetical protein [Bryobacteraceae bacterium]
MNARKMTLAILLIAAMVTSGQEKRIIDLTAPEPVGATRARAPGISIGSSSGGPIGPVNYSLPLALRISRATHDTGKQLLVADVSVQNAGTDAMTIPVSTNSAVHRDGNRGRRKLIFTIHFASGQNAVVRRVAGATFGSVAEPDSLLELKPGESVTFRIALRMTDSEAAAFVEPPSRTSLKAGYYEYTTLDELYEVSAMTKEVVSAVFHIEHAGQVIP